MPADFLPEAPLVLNWALSNRCNFRCRHCYSRTETHEDLDTATLRELIRKAAAASVLSINFGGGEPLLRQDLFEIARCATEAGLLVSLNTNGYLLDQDAADKLAQAGVRKVGVSIDSHRPEAHDGFRGVTGSQEKAIAALAHLHMAGIETSVSTVICRINAGDLAALADMAAGAGATAINFHDYKCSGLGQVNRDELDLAPGEWRVFYEQALAMKAQRDDLQILVEDPMTAQLGPQKNGSAVKGSVCGKMSLCVKANGDITPCGFIPTVIGNLLVDDLREVWADSTLLAAMRGKRAKGKCVSCDHYSACLGGCTARALAMTGDLNSPDPHCWTHEPR